jgi:hypothetical protein
VDRHNIGHPNRGFESNFVKNNLYVIKEGGSRVCGFVLGFHLESATFLSLSPP